MEPNQVTREELAESQHRDSSADFKMQFFHQQTLELALQHWLHGAAVLGHKISYCIQKLKAMAPGHDPKWVIAF